MPEGSVATELDIKPQAPPPRFKETARAVIGRFKNRITGPRSDQAQQNTKYEPTWPERVENDDRQHAHLVEQQIGKVPRGFVRLYRGVSRPVGPVSKRSGEPAWSFFSNKISKAQTFAGAAPDETGGQLFAVDIPVEDLSKYANPNGFNRRTGLCSEFVLPPKIAETARPVWFKPGGGYSKFGTRPELAGTEAPNASRLPVKSGAT